MVLRIDIKDDTYKSGDGQTQPFLLNLRYKNGNTTKRNYRRYNHTSDIGIGGTLTYEDVANVDSIGVVTARSGINVPSGNVNK